MPADKEDDDDKPIAVPLRGLKRETVEELLVQMIRKHNRGKLMSHKRSKQDDDDTLLDESSDAMKAQRENSKLVDLHNENGEPSDIPMTDEDVDDDEIAEALSEKRKVAKPEAEKSERPKLKGAKYKAKRNPKAR